MRRTRRATTSAATSAEPVHGTAEAEPAPVPAACKRGKNPTTVPPRTASSSNAQSNAPEIAKKKSRGKNAAASKPSTLSVSADTGDSPSVPIDDEAPPLEQAQRVTQTPQRDPRPNRPCNKHPGQPDQPQAKRSSAEVQAAKAELEAIRACAMSPSESGTSSTVGLREFEEPFVRLLRRALVAFECFPKNPCRVNSFYLHNSARFPSRTDGRLSLR